MAKVLGFTQDIQVCGCCGKQDLKGTYAIELEGVGEVQYYGSVCASKLHNVSNDEKSNAKKKFNKEQKDAKKFSHLMAEIEKEGLHWNARQKAILKALNFIKSNNMDCLKDFCYQYLELFDESKYEINFHLKGYSTVITFEK